METRDPFALRLTDVTMRYDDHRGIFNINLAIKRGEIFGFLGPNGAGKTTTINTILDLLKPQKGTITLLGYDHHQDAKTVHHLIGFVSGDMAIDPTLTGKQYLRYAANLHGGIHPDRIATLVKRLQADTSVKISKLSRGNKQKIGLIAALMHDPELLIFDEPTTGLDPLIQAEFTAIIREIRARGKTVFISSHILNEVQTICDRVAFIRDGEIVKSDALDNLLNQTFRRVVAHFKKAPPYGQLQHLPGVQALNRDGQTLTFSFNGDINKLLHILASHPLVHVQIDEPNLESLFMNYYQEETAHV